MNAPIADQIKAEAAKSLLERMAEKTKLVRFFRYNASAKHGVPIDNDEVSVSFNDPPVEQPQPVAQPQPIVVEPVCNVDIREPVKVQDGSGDKMKGILQALAGVAVVGAALWGGTKLADNNTDKNTDINLAQPYQESRFQYLEDQGEHLP